MSYNQQLRTKTIRGLVNAGADLMKNMYDIKIYFPSANGGPEQAISLSYPVTCRASGFKIPDVEAATYQTKYHGIALDRPKTEQTFERKFDIEFREDAAFDLRRRLTAWHMAVVDPVTGGVSNSTLFYGRVEVATVAGTYFASTLATPNGSGDDGDKDVFRTDGHLTNRSAFNPLAIWKFYGVWVGKVAGIDFQTETGEANKFSVTFYFQDYDAPQYGGNTLDLGDSSSWV
jgi:hypothetical protein